MGTFNREDYERVYRFAKETYYKSRGKVSLREALTYESCRIMDMCEEVIGQQSDRPVKSRGYQKVIHALVQSEIPSS